MTGISKTGNSSQLGKGEKTKSNVIIQEHVMVFRAGYFVKFEK